MTKVDARLNRGELQALLAAIDCFTNDPNWAASAVLWWKGEAFARVTLEDLGERFEEELKLLGD